MEMKALTIQYLGGSPVRMAGGKQRSQWGSRSLITKRSRSGLILLLLLCGAICAPSIANGASALTELIEEIENSSKFDLEKVTAVYREAVLRGESIDRAVESLAVYARLPGLSPAGQANCNLAIAYLQWRDGAIEDAVVSSDKALESSPTGEALLLKARLLDADGKEEQAREWYQRAAALGEGDEQWLIRVRLAMMDVSARNVEALEELASERDQDFRNQAAVVLALLGRPDRAIALYKPLPEAGKLFQQHVRLSEWALKAESHDRAREQAWLGYAAAPVRADRLYALSLLAESYRSAGEQDLLLEDLAQRDPEDQDLLRLRVETLIETEAYHEAIQLYEELEGSEADIAERRRLVALYEAAGDTDAMVREYRRMLDEEPDQVQWYDGLAAHYLNLADNDAALSVWETLEGRNAESAAVLVEGARLMLEMGFVDESVAMVERHLQAHGPDVGALLFLFETWLNRGEDELALNALVRLEEYLPADAAELVDLADAYERLSRPEEALRVFEAIRDTRGELGYDEQMRLAWLYTLVDRKQEALNLWRDIWVGVESPARRSFAESQLLLLAAELGALGDMAVELEGMLIEGTANRNHMNLLVRIYTESGDQLSATEIIDEYAVEMGEDEVGHQQLLAQVYMLLEDYPSHYKALRRLYEIDPENRIDHIKSIIINLLTFDLAIERNERFEAINRWIGELRELDAEAVSGEFEANIYSMAGFGEQAIKSFRRALVEQPENSDNLLLLADVLKSNGRSNEAVAILQFFAEHAVEDNKFVVAIDGIINMIGTQSFFQQPRPEVAIRLDWTRRVILERIAGNANKFYLYELLADIAREKGDTEASFVALENSLAEAGLRRPAVLRELLTMATPNAGFGGFDTGEGDIERQLKHGRRLVGLRQQLPPEVYIDVGKSLLAKEDVSGAERAFEMIDDITGMIDIDRTKAEIFEEAGYEEQSRVFYNRALNVNRDNIELLHRSGFLHEAVGQENVAFRRYLTAILGVLRRLDTVLAAGALSVDPNSLQALRDQQTDTTVTREFQEHYASLEQGLLLTWPRSTDESDRATAELNTVFEEELRNVLHRDGGNLLPLARYARLDRTARLIRRVGFFLDESNLSRFADLQLIKHFAVDGTFAREIRKQYADAGRAMPEEAERLAATVKADANAGAPGSTLRRQLALAEIRGDFETQLQLLTIAGATEEIETLLRERILDGSYWEGLGYALAMLADDEFKGLAMVALPKLIEDRSALLAMLGSHLDMYLEAEQVAGDYLIPTKEVVALLMSEQAWNLASDPTTNTSGFWGYLESRGTVDDRIRYLQALVKRSGVDRVFLPVNPLPPLHALLKERLNARQQVSVTDAAITFLSKLSRNSQNVYHRLIPVVLVADALPDNAGVLYRIAEYMRDRWPAFPDVRPLLQALYEQRLDEAFEKLIEVQNGVPAHIASSLSFLGAGLVKALEGPRLRMLDMVASGRSVQPGVALAAYELEFGAFRGRPLALERLERKAVVLDNLLKLSSRNDIYREDLIEAWLALGNTRRAGQAIAAKHQAAPDDESWRLALVLFLASEQRFEEALALASVGSPDLRDAKLLQEAVLALTERASGRPLSRIVSKLHSTVSAGMPGIATAKSAGVAGSMRLGAADSTARRQTPVERLMDSLKARDHEAGRNALREAWRGLWVWRNSPYAPRSGSVSLPWLARSLVNMPLQGRSRRVGTTMPVGAVVLQGTALGPAGQSLVNATGEDTQERRMLLDAVAEAPYGAEELGRYLRAMSPESRKGFHQLYEYLAQAILQSEGLNKRMRKLTSRLHAQQIDDHGFTLWMLLQDEMTVEFGPGDLDAFARRAAAMVDPAPFQLLLAARVFARAGAVEAAVEHYKLVAARRIQHDAYADARRASSRLGSTSPEVSDLSALIDEVVEKLPLEAAREVVDSVLSIAKRTGEAPGSETIFHAFVLMSLEKLYPPDELIEQAKRRSAGVLELPETLVGYGGGKAAELVRTYARSGDFRRALEILGEILTIPEPGVQPPPSPLAQKARASAAIVQKLSDLYGIRFFGNPFAQFGRHLSGLQELSARQGRVFGKGSESWPGAEEWTAAVTDALLGWLKEKVLHPDQAVQLLVAVGMRPDLPKESAQESNVLPRLLATIEAGKQPLGAASLMLLAPKARETGNAVQFEWVADLLNNGGLPWQQQLSLLRAYEGSEDTLRILELFRNAGLNAGLAVSRKLFAMAEESGDISFAKELQQRVEREEAARRELWVGSTHGQ